MIRTALMRSTGALAQQVQHAMLLAGSLSSP